MKLEPYLPVITWLRRYSRRDLSGDLSAGLIVAVMLVPQGMAYAMLAGLPPVTGLYAATIPLVLYALFGSSKQLAVGPVAIVSLLTLSGVSALAPAGSAEFIALAALLALLVGAVQLGLGLVRAGFIVNFLSHAVISGFTSAAAIVIGLSQLKHLLGVGIEASEPLHLLLEAARRIGEINPATLTVGLSSLLLLILFRRWGSRVGPLVVVVLGSLAASLLNLPDYGVRIVGEVPQGFPALALPDMNVGALLALLPVALTIAFVGFMESVAVAKSIAAKERYKISPNQELIGLGLANLGTAAFSGFPVTGGFSRSAVNYQAGARTPLASIITAVLVGLTLLFFTPLFYHLPQAVLAAIVMVAVYGLIDAHEPRHLFKVKPIDGWTLVLTFAATLFIGIEQGILIGAAFSLLVFIWRSAYPHTAELGFLREEGVFRNVQHYPQVERFPEALIVRPDASLYFANMAFLEGWINRAINERPELEHLILDFSGVNDIDAVALETLEALMLGLKLRGIDTHIANMKGPVRDVTVKAHWDEKFGGNLAHLSVEKALEHLGLMPFKRPVLA